MKGVILYRAPKTRAAGGDSEDDTTPTNSPDKTIRRTFGPLDIVKAFTTKKLPTPLKVDDGATGSAAKASFTSDIPRSLGRKAFDFFRCRARNMTIMGDYADRIHLNVLSLNEKIKAKRDFITKTASKEEDYEGIDDQTIMEENEQMKELIKEYEIGIDLLMAKYREEVGKKLDDSEVQFSHESDEELIKIINEQQQRINEMVGVMRAAAKADEDGHLKMIEYKSYLKMENKALRELVEIAQKYGSFPSDNLASEKDVKEAATQTSEEDLKENEVKAEVLAEDQDPLNTDDGAALTFDDLQLDMEALEENSDEDEVCSVALDTTRRVKTIDIIDFDSEDESMA